MNRATFIQRMLNIHDQGMSPLVRPQPKPQPEVKDETKGEEKTDGGEQK